MEDGEAERKKRNGEENEEKVKKKREGGAHHPYSSIQHYSAPKQLLHKPFIYRRQPRASVALEGATPPARARHRRLSAMPTPAHTLAQTPTNHGLCTRPNVLRKNILRPYGHSFPPPAAMSPAGWKLRSIFSIFYFRKRRQEEEGGQSSCAPLFFIFWCRQPRQTWTP